MEVPWLVIIQNAETCGKANKCLPDTGFSHAGALWKWEPHLYSLLPSEHVAGPIHFPVLWTLLTQAQQNQALFFCKGSIWFQVIKEKPRTCCWVFDKHLGGCTGALFPRVPLWLQRHILQRSLFGVLAYQDNLGSAPGGNWFTQNSSTSAQILESNRRLKWDDHYPLTHTHGTLVSWTHREWVEGRHEAKEERSQTQEMEVKTSWNRPGHGKKGRWQILLTVLPTIYCPFFLRAILFREDNVTSPG